jgi:RNA polymerase sigma factor (sigma-70 family)
MSSGEEVAELFIAHSARVRRTVRCEAHAPEELVEDACQLAWSRLLAHRGRVRRDTAMSWLVRTAVHEAFRQMRRAAREQSLEALTEAAGEPPVARTPDLLHELVEQRARLAAIRILPERQQRLVWLQGLGLTYTEMAGQTGATRRTVERQLLRAKQALSAEAA